MLSWGDMHWFTKKSSEFSCNKLFQSHIALKQIVVVKISIK